MLLSHNYNVTPDIIPPLSREEFADVFQVGLSHLPTCQTKQLNHPHWMVEIQFPTTEFSPQQIGELCAQALVNKRQSQGFTEAQLPDILLLGGIKTTPPISTSPETLQPGDWGVDVVETRSSASFLEGIGWESSIAQKPKDSIFRVERATSTTRRK